MHSCGGRELQTRWRQMRTSWMQMETSQGEAEFRNAKYISHVHSSKTPATVACKIRWQQLEYKKEFALVSSFLYSSCCHVRYGRNGSWLLCADFFVRLCDQLSVYITIQISLGPSKITSYTNAWTVYSCDIVEHMNDIWWQARSVDNACGVYKKSSQRQRRVNDGPCCRHWWDDASLFR